jgi:archaellum component FlaF (FlaF/FlaG flagellin family)
MEHTIPALLIAAVMILGGVLIADLTNDSINNVNDSWRQVELISEERLGTDLKVLSTEVNPDGSDITVVVLNDGRTSLSEFERMDLIVNYDGADLQRHNRWLPYTEELVQPSNTWKITAFVGDFRNPGVLDSGEQMTINIKISPPALAGLDRWFVLATDTGVTYSVYF